MGQDDENEGHGPGECVEHVWQFRQVLMSMTDGSTREYGCTRCPAIKMVARSRIR